MKKFILIASGLFLTIGIIASCSGRNAEKEREDSIRIADSIAAVEAAQAAAEQARLDSIRQDSITKREEALASIPTFREFEKNCHRGSFFKTRGFNVSEKHIIEPSDIGEYYVVKATYNPTPDVYCAFENYIGGWGGFKITIDGAPEILDQIYKDAKAFVNKKNKEFRDDESEEEIELERSGNSVEINYYNIG